MHGHRGRRGFSRDAGRAGPMRRSRRLWQLLVLTVVAALVVSIAGAVGVPSAPRAAAATATDDNPEPSVPARSLPAPADDSKDRMPSVETDPVTTVVIPVPAGHEILKVVAPDP